MTLTVPKAGIVAGRSANVQVAPDQTGEIVAQFGAGVANLGNRLENDRLARQRGRLQVDLTRDLNNVRLDLEQIGDPDEVDQQWTQRVGQLRQQYFEGVDENGRPRVDVKNRDQIGLAFDDLANRHSYALAQKGLAARWSEREANYAEYEHEAVNQSRTADADTRDGLLAAGLAQIDELVADGVITPKEAHARKRRLAGNMSNATAISMVEADPEAFLELSDIGEFDALGGETVAKYRNQAQANIASADKAAQTAADKLARDRASEIGGRLDDIIDIAQAGRVAVDETFLASEEVRSHPKFAEAQAAIALREEKPGLATMSVAELNTEIEAERKRPASAPFQTERLTVLEKARDAKLEGWRGDPVAQGRAAGIPTPDLAEFDAADPKAYAAGLRQRLSHSNWLRENGYTENAAVLDDTEAAALRDAARPDADPATRAVLARTLAAALGDDVGTTLAQIGADPVLAYATRMTLAGTPAPTITNMMEGARRIADGSVKLPAKSEFAVAVQAITGGQFDRDPVLAAQMLAGARALYAQEPTEDPTQIDEGTLLRAVQLSMGAMPDANGRLTVGGFQSIDRGFFGSEYSIPLPAGVPVAGVMKALDAIEADLGNHWVPDDPKAQGPTTGSRRVPSLDRLASASLTGNPPWFGNPQSDGYDPAEDFSRMKLEPIWRNGRPGDEYVLYDERASGRDYLRDSSGAVFTFSLRKLVGVTSK